VSTSPFAKPVCFVAEPGNVNHQTLIGKAKPVGFGGFAVRAQHGEDRVNEQKALQLRDAARAAGMYCAAWIGLELAEPFDMQEAGRVAAGLAPHYDGLLLNAEQRSMNGLLVLLPEIPLEVPLMWSSLPTFPAGEVVRQLDNRLAYLGQQAYSLENGHSPESCRLWALGGMSGGFTYPTLNVGWWYRATINGAGRRGQIVAQDHLGYKFKENRNTWGLRPDTRQIFQRMTGKVVGQLGGLWGPSRWAPTIRTTPMGDGRYLSAAEIRGQRLAAPAPIGSYLGETTQDDQWAGWT
jgi:hypothetical protein